CRIRCPHYKIQSAFGKKIDESFLSKWQIDKEIRIMNDTMYCQGCGAPLQTTDERKIGYIPKITDRDDLMCRRCFKLRHYNVVESVSIHSDDYKNMVAEIRETNSLIIHLIDVFDVDSTLIESLPRFVG